MLCNDWCKRCKVASDCKELKVETIHRLPRKITQDNVIHVTLIDHPESEENVSKQNVYVKIYGVSCNEQVVLE